MTRPCASLFAIAGSLVASLVACDAPMPADAPDAAVVSDAPPAIDTSPLSIDALGVQGFVLRRGSDAIMTAPMFTRQSAVAVGLNLPLDADTAAIDAGLAATSLADLRAVVSGHAHYDHLLDVPHVLSKAAGAALYTNLSGRHMLAAVAPDRPGCTNPVEGPLLARDRVIAVDDPLASYVDYTNCASLKPPDAPLEGRWLQVPGSRVRLMPICSMHPAQLGPYHFGEGSVDEDQCELPSAAAGWKEGLTVAFLIDFLDATSGEPAFRVFYQDAPTDAPVGHVPAAVLADKHVDVALLCVGATDSVDNHPGAIISTLAPRYALSGHWEDFFDEEASDPPAPIPLLDLSGYLARADAALPGPADAAVMVDGSPRFDRHVLVQPGAHFDVPRAP